jgi:hypothetical protein
VVSQAERHSDALTLRTTVTPSGPAVDGAQFYMPALQSLRLVKQQSDQIAYSQDFLRLYREFKNVAVKREGPKWTFETNLAIVGSGPARAFRIVHPILIRHGETRDCIMVAALSPVPVNLPITDCRTLGRN